MAPIHCLVPLFSANGMHLAIRPGGVSVHVLLTCDPSAVESDVVARYFAMAY